MRRLERLTWTHSWTSVMGCIHGCLKYLDIAPNFSWLFGGTGHAFLINMSRDGSCPSGPTAWNTTRFFELGENLGYKIEGIFGNKREPKWEEVQERAWELTRSAIDNNMPVIGWELAIPEFYVITGYDRVGYYFDGPAADAGPSPKPWRDLGESGIGLLEILALTPTEPAKKEQIVRDALAFAIAFNEGSTEWVLPEYRSGQDAYDAWIEAVRSGKSSLMGHAYNSAVWAECRKNALAFLQETKREIDGKLGESINGAIRSYGEVAQQLTNVSELYPFFENNRDGKVGKNTKSEKTVEHLKAAELAETEGIGYLKDLLKELS